MEFSGSPSRRPLHEHPNNKWCLDIDPDPTVQAHAHAVRQVTISRASFRLLLGATCTSLVALTAVALAVAMSFFGHQHQDRPSLSALSPSPEAGRLLDPRTNEPESPHYWQWCTEVRSPCDKAFNRGKAFCNSSLGFEVRARDIVSRVSLEHYPWLLSQSELVNFTSGGYCSATTLPVDGIPGMDWSTEGLHGLAVSEGNTFTQGATSFPNVVTTASSWSRANFFEVGRAIGQESRAFWNQKQLSHLAMWTPNINIVRDPRWGRAQETPGEDPYLTSEYAVNFVNGMQKEDSDGTGFVQASACLKHYLAYSFENSTALALDRMNFSAEVDEFDLQHTFLPMFERVVKNTSVGCVMCSYNAVNGVPACANPEFIKDKLYGEWGFKGYVVSDCGAVGNVENTHRYTKTFEETVRAVLSAGVNLECDSYFSNHADDFVALLKKDKNLLNLARESLVKIFMARLRLGVFESGDNKPFASVAYDPPSVPGDWNGWRPKLNAHQKLALRIATEGMVLLKNANLSESTMHPNGQLLPARRALPISVSTPQGKRKKISFIGPLIDSVDALQGNYRGPISYGQDDVTFYWGFRATLRDVQRKIKESPKAEVHKLRELLARDETEPGSDLRVDVDLKKLHGCEGSDFNRYGDQTLLTPNSNVLCDDDLQMEAAAALAAQSDDVVLVVGMDQTWEGEQPTGDRHDILLPRGQVKLIQNVLQAVAQSQVQARVHLVVVGGAALDLSEYIDEKQVSSIVWAGYPSQAGGRALANLLLGLDPLTVQPVGFSGRLTTTWYNQQYFTEFTDPTRSLLDMRMRRTPTTPGRGYRYYTGSNVLFPFGYGLTYAEFEVRVLPAGSSGSPSVRVINPSKRKASYVQLVYGEMQGAEDAQSSQRYLQLCNFYRVEVEAQSELTFETDCDTAFPDLVTRRRLRPTHLQMPDGSLQKL
eukprot:TRINITY_DN6702_c0_g1_i2.p1 TRINITY_DN6702_c0_g1~~TRINITY_DN6702_c0_g1_i2.p1  ORF type:complete len:935 (-),score=149.56 TRINITY_DN6702_c0_g1_i2:46-2850(-)